MNHKIKKLCFPPSDALLEWHFDILWCVSNFYIFTWSWDTKHFPNIFWPKSGPNIFIQSSCVYYIQSRGLTQEEADEDIKLLKLSEYAIPSTKYKISNPIMNKSKRDIITSLYDNKDISLDLAKTNNQLINELNSLKKQITKIKNDIINNKTQIEISKLQKQMIKKQYELILNHKTK